MSDIVDKTASFVARNGPEFEHRIRQNEVKNPKFNFLNLTDAYHAYYQHKVKEFKEGKGRANRQTRMCIYDSCLIFFFFYIGLNSYFNYFVLLFHIQCAE